MQGMQGLFRIPVPLHSVCEWVALWLLNRFQTANALMHACKHVACVPCLVCIIPKHGHLFTCTIVGAARGTRKIFGQNNPNYWNVGYDAGACQ